MLQRCHSPSAKDYPRYGAKGIAVCDRWRFSFENFFADMGHRPTGKSIDRIDNNKGYEPGNCRWATIKEQNRNVSTNRYIEYAGERMLLIEWAERLGMKAVTLHSRLREGWTIERALTTPVVRRFANAK